MSVNSDVGVGVGVDVDVLDTVVSVEEVVAVGAEVSVAMEGSGMEEVEVELSIAVELDVSGAAKVEVSMVTTLEVEVSASVHEGLIADGEVEVVRLVAEMDDVVVSTLEVVEGVEVSAGDVLIVITKVESDEAVAVKSLVCIVMVVVSAEVGVDVAGSVEPGELGMDVEIGLSVAVGLDVVIGLNAVRVLLVVAVELKRDEDSDNSVETVLLAIEDGIERDVESVSEEVGVAEVDWVGGSVVVLPELLPEALGETGKDCVDGDGNGLGVSIGAVVVDVDSSKVESMGEEVSIGTMVKMEVNVTTGVNEKEASLSVVEDEVPTNDDGEMSAVVASWVVDAWTWMVEIRVLVVVLVVVVVVS